MLTFASRITWKDGTATIPELTDLEVAEVLRLYRPTPDNRVCHCGGSTICPACMLTQIVAQLLKYKFQLRSMTMIGVEFGFRSGEKGKNLEATLMKAAELYDDAKEFKSRAGSSEQAPEASAKTAR